MFAFMVFFNHLMEQSGCGKALSLQWCWASFLCTHAVTGGGGGNDREEQGVLRKEACEKCGPTTWGRWRAQAVPRQAGSASQWVWARATECLKESKSLAQQSPTFLLPGTGFVEDSLSTDLGWGVVSGWPKDIALTCHHWSAIQSSGSNVSDGEQL